VILLCIADTEVKHNISYKEVCYCAAAFVDLKETMYFGKKRWESVF